jgi:hypothetical protein
MDDLSRAARYRTCAKHFRLIAECRSGVDKASLLDIATCYDQIAKSTETIGRVNAKLYADLGHSEKQTLRVHTD